MDGRRLLTAALDYNDNVRASHENQESDFILLPTLGLNMNYPITEHSLLQLNLTIGYSKYFSQTDLSKLKVTFHPEMIVFADGTKQVAASSSQ